MDYRKAHAIQSDAQLSGSQDDAIKQYIESRLMDVHTCLPGRVISFDPVAQTAVVQPCIQRIFIEQGPVNLPPCMDVSVSFTGGGGFFLTFCPAEGDECILHFSERAIDFWFQNGGIQLPSEYCTHDLGDAFAAVGVNSQPNVLPNLCTTGAELRTRDKTTFLRVEAGTITMKGNVVITGSVTASGDVTGNGKSLDTHIHSGVQTGSGNTGEPV